MRNEAHPAFARLAQAWTLVKSEEANIDGKGCTERRNLGYLFFSLFFTVTLAMKLVKYVTTQRVKRSGQRERREESVTFDFCCICCRWAFYPCSVLLVVAVVTYAEAFSHPTFLDV